MKQWFKQLLPMLAGMAIITSQSTLAVQPVSDDELAEAASKNFLVLNEAVAENKVFIIQQDQILSETPSYQSLNIIALLYPEDFVREIGQQHDYFTRNFGNEWYSFRWAGNYDEIWANNQYYEIQFNHETGSYEASNVRGRVWTIVEPYYSNSDD